MVQKMDITQVTVWCFSFFIIGTVMSVIGPTLPDLQHMYKASLAEISNLFLIMGFSLNFGNLLFVYITEFLDPNIILLACSLLGSASTPFLGVTPNIYVAFLAMAVDGALLSCLFNCILHQCNSKFPGVSSLTHVLLAASSLGAAAAPLLAKPFLQRTESQQTSLNTSIMNRPPANVSSRNSDGEGDLVLRTSKVFNTTTNTSIVSYLIVNESKVYIIYIILGMLFLSSAFGYGLLFMFTRCGLLEHSTKEDTIKGYTNLDMDAIDRTCVYVTFLILLVAAYFISTGIPFAYGEYLTIYGVEGSSHLSVQSMTVMTSAYWLLFTLGRMMGTGLSVCVEQSILIFVCLIGVLASPVVAIFAAPKGELGLWVGSMSLAFFSGPLAAAMLNWCGICIPLSPFVIGLCSVGDLSGMAVIPYLTGQVAGSFGITSFLYFIAALSAFQLPMFIILFIVGILIRQRRKKI